jgi:hypothetical protein
MTRDSRLTLSRLERCTTLKWSRYRILSRPLLERTGCSYVTEVSEHAECGIVEPLVKGLKPYAGGQGEFSEVQLDTLRLIATIHWKANFMAADLSVKQFRSDVS